MIIITTFIYIENKKFDNFIMFKFELICIKIEGLVNPNQVRQGKDGTPKLQSTVK